METRVYLYGLRDLEGQEQARVEYRSIRLAWEEPISIPMYRKPRDAMCSNTMGLQSYLSLM